jgi:serine/threonine protein kinase
MEGPLYLEQVEIGMLHHCLLLDEENVSNRVLLNDNAGSGAFATVYRAKSVSSGLFVALKKIHINKLNAKTWGNLENEIRIMQSLSHPNIVRLDEYRRTSSKIVLIMEFCEHGNLSQAIRATAPSEHSLPVGLPLLDAQAYLKDLVSALVFMRQHSVIHRDLKPQNLLLASSPNLDRYVLKVADFGFSRLLADELMANTTCGTPLYMAPEVMEGKSYDASVDCWSVGAILYEMLSGRPPWVSASQIDLHQRMLTSSPDYGLIQPRSGDAVNLIRNLLVVSPSLRMQPQDIMTCPFVLNSPSLNANMQVQEPESSPETMDDPSVQVPVMEAFKQLQVDDKGIPQPLVPISSSSSTSITPAAVPVSATAPVPVPVPVSSRKATETEPTGSKPNSLRKPTVPVFRIPDSVKSGSSPERSERSMASSKSSSQRDGPSRRPTGGAEGSLSSSWQMMDSHLPALTRGNSEALSTGTGDTLLSFGSQVSSGRIRSLAISLLGESQSVVAWDNPHAAAPWQWLGPLALWEEADCHLRDFVEGQEEEEGDEEADELERVDRISWYVASSQALDRMFRALCTLKELHKDSEENPSNVGMVDSDLQQAVVTFTSVFDQGLDALEGFALSLGLDAENEQLDANIPWMAISIVVAANVSKEGAVREKQARCEEALVCYRKGLALLAWIEDSGQLDKVPSDANKAWDLAKGLEIRLLSLAA